MGCLSLEELTALFFDGEGNLIDTQTRSLPAAPDMRGLSSSDPRFEQVVAKATQAWHDEMRFQPSVIKVRRFDHDGLKIEDLPDSYQEFISDPEAFELDEDERARWREQVTQWMNEGMFVLWWGKDYWINSAGEVDST
jgi:hypothetical protein